jgi:hypothetical protein
MGLAKLLVFAAIALGGLPRLCSPGVCTVPCQHRMHQYDVYPCSHPCQTPFGVVPCHPQGDVGPCMHPVHAYDLVPC